MAELPLVEEWSAMDRRTFIGAVTGAILTQPPPALAQSRGKIARIGYLRRISLQPADISALRQGLQELGYVEGQNLVIEERYANGDTAKLPDLAREMQQLKVDALVVDGPVTVRAIRSLVGSTPIIFTLPGDPVEAGLVASLDRPGGNITGVTTYPFGPKRLQLLREIVPAGRVGVLNNPANSSPTGVERMNDTATSLGIELVRVHARSPAELAEAFAELSRARVVALLVATDAMFFVQRNRIAELAAQFRLPAIYLEREFCDAGGLICYGVSVPGNFRRAAAYVDRILKGAKPGDLPVEQPTKFELVVNLQAAKALGLVIPQALRLRADELIE
jgi:putative ABC transport system substrate-binding protein